ncbi:hypothetical protein ACFOGJ_26900 [Marinibaculum pumilum]|uniref:3-phosphoshikimate 1-carboxyvinyltransferase n=1 Tax=Marinibaculum pumilum TaxID=1766165 RepID=A0ABV7L8F9_9PROT
MHRREIRQDPFFHDFFGRIPKETWPTFTEDQLFAIKRAFGARYRGAHMVDLRVSLPIPFRRMYMVLLIGGEKRSRNRRSYDRRSQPLVTAGNIVFGLFFFGMLLLALLGILYTLKSWIGIDLFPGMSLGLWQEFSSQVRETVR